jgi:hypothetical protein
VWIRLIPLRTGSSSTTSSPCATRGPRPRGKNIRDKNFCALMSTIVEHLNKRLRSTRSLYFSNGWGTRIRTWIDGVRVRCPTVERSPNFLLLYRNSSDASTPIITTLWTLNNTLAIRRIIQLDCICLKKGPRGRVPPRSLNFKSKESGMCRPATPHL